MATKPKVKDVTEAPKVTLGIPDLLKKQSRFSGGSAFGGKGSPVKFTPRQFRVTQHKGG